MRLGNLKLFTGPRYIGGRENPLLKRWVIFRIPWFGIFLHKFCRSDHDRALHDHPWWFVSVILKGGYKEICDEGTTFYHEPGDIIFRPAEWRHRVVIEGKPSWNLILVGRRARRWGFWPNGSWCWWRTYDYSKGICSEEELWTENED